MTKSNGGKTTYTPTEFQFYAPKENQTIGQFFHNSKDGTFFGRTLKSWGQLMIFYGIFYIVLAALFTICMQGLFASLDDNKPKWQLDDSLIGTNPGLGFRPISEITEYGSVIKYNDKQNDTKTYWIELIDDFLKKYNESSDPTKEKICNFNTQKLKDKEFCNVDITNFGDCSRGKAYGYNNSRPCVFLKLNKIFNWVPEYYDDPELLDASMPSQLKDHINSTSKVKPEELKQVWVSCDGTHGPDKEKITNVNYYPYQGFPGYYYPYLNQEGYLSPIIAVQFPNLPHNNMVNIECRAWAKNIIYSGSVRDRKGSVTFQILID